MIRIKGQKEYLVALESVAMTDIVLNMFIFFFISFSLLYTFSPSRLSKIEVQLPKAASAVAITGSEAVIIEIAQSGKCYVNGENVRGADLERVLRARTATAPGVRILLKIDAHTRFAIVAHVLDVINALGVNKVSIAART